MFTGPTQASRDIAMTTTLSLAPSAPAQPEPISFDEAERNATIAEAAYFLTGSRGFALGRELEHWLNAEWEVDQRQASHSIGSVGTEDPR
jgi:hypothetical protein